MVGYAKWEAPTPEMASEIRGELFEKFGGGMNPSVPEEGADLEQRDPLGLNDDLAEESTERMVSVRDGYLKGRKVLKLALLATILEWRGKGVGSALLKWGLEVADKKGMPVWVDASPMSLSFYESWGFIVVGRSEHELGVGTAKGVVEGRYTHTGIVREMKEAEGGGGEEAEKA